MKGKETVLPHKLGANRKELARKRGKQGPGFLQSRDLREDRGERQSKFVRCGHSV